MKLSIWFRLLKDTVVAWSDDFAPSMGAAISYYTMFSLAPLLVLVIAVAGLAFGAEAVQGQIGTQLSSLMGDETAQAVQSMIESAAVSDNGLWAAVLSVAILIVGATSVFGELQSALDRIWHVPESKKPSGIWGMLRTRVFSFGLILGLAFLLMVSLAVSAGLAAFGGFIGGLLPGQEILLQALNLIVSFVVMTLLFAMIYKLMPTTPVAWGDVWVGAAVTALLFEVGKFGIGLYLGKSDLAEAYAGAGSLVILLVWVYYAAQIFLLGAEFTKVYSQTHGSNQDQAQSSKKTQVSTAKESSLDVVVDDGQTLPAVTDEIDRRVSQAASELLPRMLLLGAISTFRLLTDRSLKNTRRQIHGAQKISRQLRRK